MYAQLPTIYFPATFYVSAGLTTKEAEEKIRSAGFELPFTVKPDVGMKGLLFRKITSWEQWRFYHEKMSVEYLVQAFVDFPIEYSVFYYRHPSSPKGIISGFIQKDLLQVKGDGLSSIKELIKCHPKAKSRMAELKVRHADKWNEISLPGQIFYLSYAGNHNRGAQFINLRHEIDGSLLNLFDKLSHHTSFFYGRYDIKASSVQALKEGKEFSILEFNGCGAEPNHIYDCGMNLMQAYRVLLTHWSALYQISAHNHRNGHRYWDFKKGYHFLKRARAHFEHLEKLDVSGI
jgi:hypothetical protein